MEILKIKKHKRTWFYNRLTNEMMNEPHYVVKISQSELDLFIKTLKEVNKK